jgi:putative alpha-1,2-mannosidase
MPLFDQATLHLASGKDLVIKSTPNAPQQLFVDKITLNEEPFERLFFTHQELTAGGTLNFQLGIVPRSKEWSADAYPYSVSQPHA